MRDMASKNKTRLKIDVFLHKHKKELQHPADDADVKEGDVVACFCEGELSDLGTVVSVELGTQLPKGHSDGDVADLFVLAYDCGRLNKKKKLTGVVVCMFAFVCLHVCFSLFACLL